MKPPPVDVDAVLREVTDTTPGWRKSTISFGVPVHGQRPSEGLASPDNRGWEVTYRTAHGGPLTPKDRKHLAEHATRQKAAGYECRLVEIDGGWSFVERMGTNIRLWDGLVLTGEWDMSGSCPWQGTVTALWTKPDRAGVEGVTLYLRHRDYGIDSDGTLWTGHVQRHDGSDIFAGIRAPWSPNLQEALDGVNPEVLGGPIHSDSEEDPEVH